MWPPAALAQRHPGARGAGAGLDLDLPVQQPAARLRIPGQFGETIAGNRPQALGRGRGPGVLAARGGTVVPCPGSPGSGTTCPGTAVVLVHGRVGGVGSGALEEAAGLDLAAAARAMPGRCPDRGDGRAAAGRFALARAADPAGGPALPAVVGRQRGRGQQQQASGQGPQRGRSGDRCHAYRGTAPVSPCQGARPARQSRRFVGRENCGAGQRHSTQGVLGPEVTGGADGSGSRTSPRLRSVPRARLRSTASRPARAGRTPQDRSARPAFGLRIPW